MGKGEPRQGRGRVVRARIDDEQYGDLVSFAGRFGMTLSDYIMTAAYAYAGRDYVSSAKGTNHFRKGKRKGIRQ